MAMVDYRKRIKLFFGNYFVKVYDRNRIDGGNDKTTKQSYSYFKIIN